MDTYMFQLPLTMTLVVIMWAWYYCSSRVGGVYSTVTLANQIVGDFRIIDCIEFRDAAVTNIIESMVRWLLRRAGIATYTIHLCMGAG